MKVISISSSTKKSRIPDFEQEAIIASLTNILKKAPVTESSKAKKFLESYHALNLVRRNFEIEQSVQDSFSDGSVCCLKDIDLKLKLVDAKISNLIVSMRELEAQFYRDYMRVSSILERRFNDKKYKKKRSKPWSSD